MITKPTVLILGAGASMPFGFPSGTGLVDHICTKINGHIRQSINSALWPLNLHESIFDNFTGALFKSGRFSIDAFLQFNPDYMEVGKLAIAAALIPFENEMHLFKSGNWYKTLFQHLNATFDDFAQNKLSVITFNYDRSLEWFLLTALRNSYGGKTYEQCREQLDKIPIFHLHGKLGKIPVTEMGVTGDCRRYLARTDPEDLSIGSRGIRVIHEDISNDPVFEEAKGLLRQAEVIAFLGFGYDEVNLKRLGVQALALTDRTCTPRYASKRKWYGTALGLGYAKTSWVKSYMLDQLETTDSSIDELLKEVPILVEPFNTVDMKKTLVRDAITVRRKD